MKDKEYKMLFDSIIFCDEGIKLKSEKDKVFSYSKISKLKILKKPTIELFLDTGLAVKKMCDIKFKKDELDEMNQLYQYISERISIANEEYIKTQNRLKEEYSKEIRKKCRVCENIFCYTKADIEKNISNEKAAARATLNSALGSIGTITSGVFGNKYDMYEMNKMSNNSRLEANNVEDKIIDYDKCPKCGSRDLCDISEDNGTTEENQTTITSSADEIKKYKELLDMGAITKEEFDKKKKELLNL